MQSTEEGPSVNDYAYTGYAVASGNFSSEYGPGMGKQALTFILFGIIVTIINVVIVIVVVIIIIILFISFSFRFVQIVPIHRADDDHCHNCHCECVIVIVIIVINIMFHFCLYFSASSPQCFWFCFPYYHRHHLLLQLPSILLI